MIKQLNELKRPENTNKNKAKEKERQESHQGFQSTNHLLQFLLMFDFSPEEDKHRGATKADNRPALRICPG